MEDASIDTISKRETGSRLPFLVLEFVVVMGQILETQRLLLVPPCRAHAQTMADMANQADIANMLSTMPHPYCVDDAFNWIRIVGEMAVGTAFSIFLKDGQQFIGCCGSGPVDDNDEIDFGYWIGVKYWGNGYATEAGRAVLSHVFETFQFEVITTDFKPENVASSKVLDKLGFTQVGERVRHCEANGQDMPTIKVELHRKDWDIARRCATSFLNIDQNV